MRKLREVDHLVAVQLLENAGLRDCLLSEGVARLIAVSNEQSVAVCHAQEALTKAELAMNRVSSGEIAQDELTTSAFTYAYFVPYDVTFSEFHNGGRSKCVHGCTMLNIEGGIKNWQNILGINHYILKTYFSEYPNATVRVVGLFEINKWKTKAE